MSDAPSLTPDQIAFAERLQAAVNTVKAKILADVPTAGDALAGGLFDAYGSVAWTPSRPAGVDFSAWGNWEVWEHQRPNAGRLEPTGDWVAWDSVSGQQIGFSDKAVMTAKHQAEMMALMMNDGRRTRVVPASGGFSASRLVYENVKAMVDARVATLSGDALPA